MMTTEKTETIGDRIGEIMRYAEKNILPVEIDGNPDARDVIMTPERTIHLLGVDCAYGITNTHVAGRHARILYITENGRLPSAEQCVVICHMFEMGHGPDRSYPPHMFFDHIDRGVFLMSPLEELN